MRAAVVGAGLMGRWHARELSRAGGSVVAVADVDPVVAGRLAARHKDARAFEDLDRLLGDTVPEVVHVCTPVGSHVDIGERVLRAGAHLLVEKPAAPTFTETERLVAVAEDSGRLMCPVHQYLFQPPVRSVTGLISSLGPMVDLSWTACSAGAELLASREAHEVAADILPHPLGVIHRILPGGVADLRWSASTPRAGELRATTVADGVSVSICVSMGGRPPCNELRLIGRRGTLRIDFFHGFGFVENGGSSRAWKIGRPFAFGGSMTVTAAANLCRRAARLEPAYPGLRSLIAALYSFVRGGGDPPIAHEESLSVARARERVLGAASELPEETHQTGRRALTKKAP